MNRLSADVEIKGSLTFAQDLLFEGRLDGDITSGNAVVVAANAVIRGTITTQNVTVFGSVEGDITAADRCEVKSTARIMGNVSARKFSIEEGATFQGRSHVQNPPQSHGSSQGR